MTFEVADALLVALDAVELWDTPPLCHHYAPAPARNLLINPLTPAQDAARTRALARRGPACEDEDDPEPSRPQRPKRDASPLSPIVT